MRADTWIVTDGARGNEKQCLALAHYLAQCGALQDSPPERLRIALRQPWDALSPRLLWAGQWAPKPAANSNSHCLDPAALRHGALPKILISCGRRAALVSRLLKTRAGSALTTIQILNPKIATEHFDWLVCPRHDQLAGSNVITTEGALHSVDDAALNAGRLKWAHFEKLPEPRVAVLVGASNGAYTIDLGYLENLLAGASALAGSGTLMVTTSRRTPEKLQALAARWLQRHHPNRHLLHVDRPGVANPYSGILAFANRIVVSSDSVNMISEALGTGSPVHCPEVSTGNQRFARFQANLIDSGRLLALNDPSRAHYPPLRETLDVAKTIARSLEA